MGKGFRRSAPQNDPMGYLMWHIIIAATKKNNMELHVFKCSADASIFGFTTDITGKDFPDNSCKGKWQFWKTINLERGVLLMGLTSDEIVDGVKAIGYHIANALDQFDDLQ
jgi:hypothetical protein